MAWFSPFSLRSSSEVSAAHWVGPSSAAAIDPKFCSAPSDRGRRGCPRFPAIFSQECSAPCCCNEKMSYYRQRAFVTPCRLSNGRESRAAGEVIDARHRGFSFLCGGELHRAAFGV